MTDPRPEYAPGDPVLVAGVVVNDGGRYGLPVRLLDEASDGTVALVRAADVHPAPSGPDARDAAIAAVRAIPDDESFSHYPEASAWVDGYNAALEHVREALDGVVPAPPAPDPRGQAIAAARAQRAGWQDAPVPALPAPTSIGRTDWLCIGHPAWPDPLSVGTEDEARRWLDEHRERHSSIRVEKRTVHREALRA